jgi:hypothetical protein
MHFKIKYKRIRPWMLAPRFAGSVRPSGPCRVSSGHATQCMWSRLLKQISSSRHYGEQLRVARKRIAKGRGLHYPSDSHCGFKLADLIDKRHLQVAGDRHPDPSEGGVA